MADYRILSPRFFFDERLHGLSCEHKMVFSYLIQGLEACSQTETGIYNITRGQIGFGTNIDTKKVCDIIDFFNHERPELLQYHNDRHVVFVKSFLKYNCDYLTTADKLINAIKKDFKRTANCTQFWAQFYTIYQKKLDKAAKQLKDSSSEKSKKLADLVDKLKEIQEMEILAQKYLKS